MNQKKLTLLDNKGAIRHLKTCFDLTAEEFYQIFQTAKQIKENPCQFKDILKGKTMLMFFEKPSLRTRVSFETGMSLMGGHGIFYDISVSPLGAAGKETLHDTAKCLTEYVDIVMARVMKKETIDGLAKNCAIPVLNGLDNHGHPCQVTSDMFTIIEAKGKIKGLKIAYYGDCENNVTYDLMRAVSILGGHIIVCCPKDAEFNPKQEIVEECLQMCKQSGGKVEVSHDPEGTAKDCDVIYTDSWMSYHVPKDKIQPRKQTLWPYRVSEKFMALAKKDCLFMNCLPADREMEQEQAVIDGPNSIVFKQAGNRLYCQCAIVLFFLGLITNQAKKEKILCALGGNALIQAKQKGEFHEQLENSRIASQQLAKIVANGYDLAVTHGNGPQVGHIYLQSENSKDKIPQQPLFANGAMTQGFIGFLLQNQLQHELNVAKTNKTCATIVTQVVVDKNDPAFQNPTKPVGKFYTEEEAKEIEKQGYTVKKDPTGKGYRIVVPSPQPKKIVEIECIKTLIKSGQVVIACGGGGIPVIEKEQGVFEGINAVIDKDLCGEVFAEQLGVDKLMILTDVEGVYINYKKENQKFFSELKLKDALKYQEEKQFGEGSMGPKVMAACRFVEKTGKCAIITSLDKACEALEGRAGTRIIP